MLFRSVSQSRYRSLVSDETDSAAYNVVYDIEASYVEKEFEKELQVIVNIVQCDIVTGRKHTVCTGFLTYQAEIAQPVGYLQASFVLSDSLFRSLFHAAAFLPEQCIGIHGQITGYFQESFERDLEMLMALIGSP